MAENLEPEQASKPASALEPKACGIIMPISGTELHSERHWRWVHELLHRAVKAANMQPLDVWTGSAADRITSRILENLYATPIAICVISGLNPNVMLETGMRLASKKPTIVVADSDAKIPFDIGDFQVLRYPRNLNIIEVENFFADLHEQLETKLRAFEAGTYKAFLSGVTIDVVEPESREITVDQLIARRFDDFSSRLDELTRMVRRTSKPRRLFEGVPSYVGDAIAVGGVREDRVEEIVKRVMSLPGPTAVNSRKGTNGYTELHIALGGTSSDKGSLFAIVVDLVRELEPGAIVGWSDI